MGQRVGQQNSLLLSGFMAKKEREKDPESARRFQMLRDKLKLDQKPLAKKLGLGVSTVQNCEAGYSYSRRTLKRYVEVSGCNRTWLLTGEGEPFPGEQFTGVSEAPQSYTTPSDPLVSAISILKQIYDSNDQTLIQVITLNLLVFQRFLKLHTEISRQSKELDILRGEFDNSIRRLDALESHTEQHKTCTHYPEPPGQNKQPS